MKKLVLLIYFFQFAIFISTAQQLVIANKKLNSFYCGVENYINIALENSSCKTININSNNGISKGVGCDWIIIPENVGKCLLYVEAKTNDSIIIRDTVEFRVRSIPEPLFIVYKESNSNYPTKINLNCFISNNPSLRNIDYDYDFKYTIKNFWFKVFRDKECIFKFYNTGNKYNESIVEYMNNIKSGDEIMFDLITVLIQNNEIVIGQRIFKIE